MAETKFIDVHGKVSWVHAVAFNKFDCWSITLHPDAESLEVLRELQSKGLKNMMKKDDDGYYMQFRRDPSKLMRGKVVSFKSPRVIDKDGAPMDGGRIGNGTDATVRLEVYTFKPPAGGHAVAARWDSLRVLNLIPFEPGRDYPDAISVVEAESLRDAPKPHWDTE